MEDLSLGSFLHKVVQYNQSTQARLLELEYNRRKYRAEYGVFEPELFGSYARESNKRQNTVQQQEAQLGTQLFDERNNIYQGGLESLVPTGARVRLGYTLRDLRNNLQSEPSFFSRGATNGEYETFFGFSLTQPLLKNAWHAATLAGIRIAALSSDIAFQDYRRQMMIIISTAEASYWNLYMAQEQVRFFRESVATAEKIWNDTQSRVKAGKSSGLEVLEAEAGLALRRSKLSEAEEKFYEAAGRVLTMYAETVLSQKQRIRAVDRPRITDVPLGFFSLWRTAFELNPDYQMQQQKLLQEYVRVGYARNQRWPELNLKGSYGLNGLGDTPGASWDNIERANYPSWTIGLEFRVPLGGGIKSANELAAARLRQKEAELSLKDVETQIVNGLDTAVHKLQSARQSIESYQTVVDFNQNLLNSAMERMLVGLLENRKVLEIEADLFEAKNSLLQAMVNYQRAVLELRLLEGSVLKHHNLELSQQELQEKTKELISRGKLQKDRYDEFIREVQLEYERSTLLNRIVPDSPTQQKAREELRKVNR